MKFGVVYPQIELKGDPEAVRRIGLAVEELGYDYLLTYDHVAGATHENREPKLPPGRYTDKDPFHDPLVMFAYLAGMTKRIEFVTGILILPQRQTVLVARQAADLDLFSHGRLRFGVATGWNYVEYDALGQDFHTRGRRLSEQVGFLRRLWSEPLVSFQGEFDRIDRASINPRPRRMIPIWFGGFTDPAFRRAAKLGDGFIFTASLEKAQEDWTRVEKYLSQAGRSSADFGRELIAREANTPAEAADAMKRWRDFVGTHACFPTMKKGLTTIEAQIDYIAEVHHRLDR